jgi:hypothetical protein
MEIQGPGQAGISRIEPPVIGERDASHQDRAEIGNSQVPEGQHKKWLILDYFAADCDLQVGQYRSLDNQELVGSTENMHIVALIDVGPKPALMDETWSGARTFYITKDDEPDKVNSPVIAEHGNKVDMTDRDVLRDFIVTNMKKFPADHVMLVLNDHGGGWTGVLEDDHDGRLKALGRVSQVRIGLEEAQQKTGKKIDILGFDACYMADFQVAYEMKDTAGIMLASQESESNKGWKYSEILGDERSQTGSPEDMARLVVEVNKVHNLDIPTFSATDLSRMDGLAKATGELAQAILDSTERNAIRDSIREAENYGGGAPPFKDMRDFYHMADLLEKNVNDDSVKESAKNIKDLLDKAVIASQSGPQHPNSHGLHIYAPISYKGVEEDYKRLNLAKDVPKWVEAMEKLGGYVKPPPSTGSPSWPF